MEYDKEFKAGQILSARHAAASYWGHRFESLIMCPVEENPSLKERFDEPVNTWVEFSILLKASMGKHRLLFAAEVDRVDVDGQTYVEVKTAAHISNAEKRLHFFENKLITFWAQSFLAGIDKLIIGYRTHNGIISSIENLQVSSIPGMVRGRVSWCPQSMLNFLNLILDWISAVMAAKPEEEVFQLAFLGDDRIELKPRPDEYPVFLPAHFAEASYC
jgi:RAT1-interacting protein